MAWPGGHLRLALIDSSAPITEEQVSAANEDCGSDRVYSIGKLRCAVADTEL